MDAEHPTGFYVLDGIVTANPAASLDAIVHLILPAIALGAIPLAIIVRITRASVLDVVHEDYVRTAEAKGLYERTITRRHVLRNALLPVVTVIGLTAGLLFSGAILTETVFAWDGVGRFVYEAIGNRDYAVLQGFILMIAILYVLVNLAVDVSYGLIDPRVRVQ
jgi:peptide/nickel transport system permease protein